MNGKALMAFKTPKMSDSTSALLSKTSENVVEILRQHLETFQMLTEISHSTASLELSVKGNMS